MEKTENSKKYPSFGYHRLAAFIRKKPSLVFSDHYIHKCCKYLDIKSKVRHYQYRKPGKEHVCYPNRVNGKWRSEKPLDVVASDMTQLYYKGKHYEWTYIIDTFNNEIISSHISGKKGDRAPYYNCMKDLLEKIKNREPSTIFHTNQGAVYTSYEFARLREKGNIIHSMSRVATPTDNAVIEALNGWIKEEIRLESQNWEGVEITESIKNYIKYYNEERPAYALNYLTPLEYKLQKGFI